MKLLPDNDFRGPKRTSLLFVRNEDEVWLAILRARRTAYLAIERLAPAMQRAQATGSSRDLARALRCGREVQLSNLALRNADALGGIDFGSVWIRLRAVTRNRYLTFAARERVVIWREVGFHVLSGLEEVERLNRLFQDFLFDSMTERPRFRSLRRNANARREAR